MALIKSEYLAWRAHQQPPSLRSRLFASTPIWLYRVPWLRHLIAWRNGSPFISRLLEKFLGISSSVPLPVPAALSYSPVVEPQRQDPIAESLFEQASHQVEGADVEKPEIVLLVDTFNRYFEPEIVFAAEQVLRAAKYTVIVAEPAESDVDYTRPLCCGRTYLAQGMVDRAKSEMERLVAALKPHVDAGRMIVGLEASCVLGLRDDALALGLGEPLEEISKRVFLLGRVNTN
jgi:Fe-S oxidoreductase